MVAAGTLALVLLTATPSSPESCRAAVPAAVAARIRKQFPHHRLPIPTDDLPDDREYDLAHGGNGCLRVASGDFDGDRVLDVAVLLEPKEPPASLVVLVVARHRRGKWALEELYRFDTGSLYLEAIPPGTFRRSKATDADHDEFDHNEVRTFKSTRTGLAAGRLESNGAAFLYTPRRWVHVWVSY